MIPYAVGDRFFQYDPRAIAIPLVEAKAAVQALLALPYQKDWVEELQKVQLKREVAGTSKIEGAVLTERELEEAIGEKSEGLLTRSQRQASAAARAYREIAALPVDRPMDEELVKRVHRWIVEGADDDHCPPGRLRGPDQNVTFGTPLHRGAEGGAECERAFGQLIEAFNTESRSHDPLILALAAHYHLAAIHPFLDGNGRTARAIEALILGRAGLRDICFVGMSNYYYEEKSAYLKALSDVRSQGYDLTPFLVFGLKGIQLQSQIVQREIRTNLAKALFRNVMHSLFARLKGPKTRVLKERQIEVLELLLSSGPLTADEYVEKTSFVYRGMKSRPKAIRRDVDNLFGLGAVTLLQAEPKEDPRNVRVAVDLEWPTKFSQSDFFQRVKKLPKAKSPRFL
jgi:Fic family protein